MSNAGRELAESQTSTVTADPSGMGYLMALFQLGIGLLTVVLAVHEGFAEGKVVFDHERWRYAFGAFGLYLAFRAARGLVRMITRAKLEIGPDQYRDSRRHGITQQLRGAGFLLVAWSDYVAERSVAFLSWTESVYVTAGIFTLVMGTLHWINPQSPLAKARLDRLRERAPRA